MRTYLSLVLTLCVAVTALSAKTFEGRLRIKITESGSQAVEMEYLSKTGFLRTNMQTEGQSAAMIVDFAKKEMIMLMPGQPLYMVMPLKDIMNKASEAGTGAKLEKTSSTQKILGYDCVKYLLKLKDSVSEMWVTEALGAFMNIPNMGGPKPSPSSAWEQALQGKDFFPLKIVTQGKDGREQNRFEVLSVEAKKLDEALFAPPAGAQRLDMGAMGGMGGLPGMPGSR